MVYNLSYRPPDPIKSQLEVTLYILLYSRTVRALGQYCHARRGASGCPGRMVTVLGFLAETKHAISIGPRTRSLGDACVAFLGFESGEDPLPSPVGIG